MIHLNDLVQTEKPIQSEIHFRKTLMFFNLDILDVYSAGGSEGPKKYCKSWMIRFCSFGFDLSQTLSMKVTLSAAVCARKNLTQCSGTTMCL